MSKNPEARNRGARPRILVVDDEADLRELLELTLVRMGLDVDLAEGVGAAKARLAEKSYDLCFTDMRMGDGDGLELVRFITAECDDLPVAVITAYGSTDNAIAALKAGAFDYLAKPVALEQLRTLVKSALDLPAPGSAPASGGGRTLIGDSAAIAEVRELIGRVAKSAAPVHISGESGSGKELAARRMHEMSGRGGAFVAVNCGAIPENLMEAEFFGVRKGAFTGADAERDGFFQAAHGGTLFLDEVADLPLAMQVKLLRVIQERQVRKVGGTAEDPVDVRIISATHQDLAGLVASGRFRQDLLYRLNVIEIDMPSLKECRDDIPLLAEAILARLGGQSGRQLKLSSEALKSLVAYDYPGNVRELENILERAGALAAGTLIEVGDLRLSPLVAGGMDEEGAAPRAGALAQGLPLQDYLDQVERAAIEEALEKTRYNRTAAAKLLGVTFRSLRYRLQRLNIE
ncbi:MAG TPA: sigma-54 dependent transcriptional regulator [Burkholderiales bacterium]